LIFFFYIFYILILNCIRIEMYSILFYLGYYFLVLLFPNHMKTVQLSNSLTEELKKELKKNLSTIYTFNNWYYDQWIKNIINDLFKTKLLIVIKKYNINIFDEKCNDFIVKHFTYIIIQKLMIKNYDFDPYSFKPLQKNSDNLLYNIPKIDEKNILEYKKKILNIKGYIINDQNIDGVSKTLLNIKIFNDLNDIIDTLNYDNIFYILSSNYEYIKMNKIIK
jgi:hypothetical protein